MRQEVIINKIDGLISRKEGMKNYLLLKFNEADWHAVQDAASDIREIETELSVYTKLINQDDQN